MIDRTNELRALLRLCELPEPDEIDYLQAIEFARDVMLEAWRPDHKKIADFLDEHRRNWRTG